MSHFPESLLSRSRNRGSILVVAVWALVFLSILSLGLARAVAGQINLFRKVEASQTGATMMQSLCLFVQKERETRKETCDTIYDLRAEKNLGLGRGLMRYTLTDEESRININTATEEVIGRLPGVGPDLARRIVGSSLRPFSVSEELLAVDKFTQEVLQACRDKITTYSNGMVNINTAPVEVLQSLGMDEALAAAILEFRRGPDRQEGTADDGFFGDLSDVNAKMGMSSLLSDVQKTTLADLIKSGAITVSSQNLTINAAAWLGEKKAMQYAVTLNKEKIKRWREQ